MSPCVTTAASCGMPARVSISIQVPLAIQWVTRSNCEMHYSQPIIRVSTQGADMRHVSIIAALAISLSASVFTQAAHASWRSSYLMGEKSGYCSDARWHRDVARCPEYRSITADQNHKRKKTLAKSAHSKGSSETHVDRIVLKGNETRLAAPNYLNTDCSSGPLPDLRVISAPKNGTYRTEEASIAAERPANDSRAACIGKPVNAVAVYYKPKDEFAGNDAMVIDVDFKNGTVRRYVYAITVR